MKRKYVVNGNFFNEWSENMAYVLGFFTADGHLEKSSVCFEVSDKDIEVLRFIKKVMGSDHSIEVSKNGIRLRIHSAKMACVLRNKYQFASNKTFDYCPKYNIPNEFKRDFVRGFFDGDGWVYNRRNGVEAGFCSASLNLITFVYSLIGNRGRIREKIDKRNNRKPLYCLEMCSNQCLWLRDFMYQNDSFALKRKKDRFWNFYDPSPRWWTKEQVCFLKQNINMPQKWLSEKMGKSVQSVNLKSFRLRNSP